MDCEILFGASRQGNEELAIAALRDGADPSQLNGVGATALHYAAKNLSLELVLLLLKAADSLSVEILDTQERVTGDTALHKAACAYPNDPESALLVLRALINEGADLEIHNKEHRKAVTLLPSSGAEEGKKLFQQAALARRLGTEETDSESEGDVSSAEE